MPELLHEYLMSDEMGERGPGLVIVHQLHAKLKQSRLAIEDECTSHCPPIRKTILQLN